EVEVVPLPVLAVIPLAVRQSEEPLFHNRIGAIPQGEREAETGLVVADSRQPVLAPSIGARARLVVAEVVPRVTGRAVVFADRAPLPFAQVRSPLLPRNPALASLLQPTVFRFLSRHGGHS